MDPSEETTFTLPDHFQVVDIRPIIAEGQEPCCAIQPLLSDLPLAHGLRLIAPFFPAPLLEMSGAQGFHIHLNPTQDSVWTIDLWRQ